MGRQAFSFAALVAFMFNFSANHLLLLQRIEGRNCIVFLMRDDSTRRVYRLYDFTMSQHIDAGHYYCIAGKVNSADKLYLVIESIKKDNKHGVPSQSLPLVDGAGGITMA